ncbi:unnamed protein product [Amoebophrya sp. A120]|nr:unnamed protein product [Amoebophrya sp. A120]|eukprot:GSA120T00025625001.1
MSAANERLQGELVAKRNAYDNLYEQRSQLEQRAEKLEEDKELIRQELLTEQMKSQQSVNQAGKVAFATAPVPINAWKQQIWAWLQQMGEGRLAVLDLDPAGAAHDLLRTPQDGYEFPGPSIPTVEVVKGRRIDMNFLTNRKNLHFLEVKYDQNNLLNPWTNFPPWLQPGLQQHSIPRANRRAGTLVALLQRNEGEHIAAVPVTAGDACTGGTDHSGRDSFTLATAVALFGTTGIEIADMAQSIPRILNERRDVTDVMADEDFHVVNDIMPITAMREQVLRWYDALDPEDSVAAKLCVFKVSPASDKTIETLVPAGIADDANPLLVNGESIANLDGMLSDAILQYWSTFPTVPGTVRKHPKAAYLKTSSLVVVLVLPDGTRKAAAGVFDWEAEPFLHDTNRKDHAIFASTGRSTFAVFAAPTCSGSVNISLHKKEILRGILGRQDEPSDDASDSDRNGAGPAAPAADRHLVPHCTKQMLNDLDPEKKLLFSDKLAALSKQQWRDKFCWGTAEEDTIYLRPHLGDAPANLKNDTEEKKQAAKYGQLLHERNQKVWAGWPRTMKKRNVLDEEDEDDEEETEQVLEDGPLVMNDNFYEMSEFEQSAEQDGVEQEDGEREDSVHENSDVAGAPAPVDAVAVPEEEGGAVDDDAESVYEGWWQESDQDEENQNFYFPGTMKRTNLNKQQRLPFRDPAAPPAPPAQAGPQQQEFLLPHILHKRHTHARKKDQAIGT